MGCGRTPGVELKAAAAALNAAKVWLPVVGALKAPTIPSDQKKSGFWVHVKKKEERRTRLAVICAISSLFAEEPDGYRGVFLNERLSV